MFFNYPHSDPNGEQGTLGLLMPLPDDWPMPSNSNVQVTTSSRPPNWLSVFNTSAALASQAIGAWGRNPTTQIGSGGVFQIGGGATAGNFPNPYSGLTPQQLSAMQSGGVGGTIGGGVDGIVNWLMANPVITFGGIAALFLLFREPPRRR